MTDTQTPEDDQTQQMMPKVDLRKARFTVSTVHGARFEQIRLMPGDVVAAERKYDIRASEIEDSAKLEHMLYMVWLAARRKDYPSEFEAFLDELEDLDVVTGEGAVNPTQPDR